MEPTYYVSTAFSGVGFARHQGDVADDATILNPDQVDPDVRAQGRAWMASK